VLDDAGLLDCLARLTVELGRFPSAPDLRMRHRVQMGFTEASGKAPIRWVAIHHGVSTNGNDHIHIAATILREDGTRWDGRFNDYKTAQTAARAIEAKYGLATVAGREFGTAVRGEKPAERAQAARRLLGAVDPSVLSRITAVPLPSQSAVGDPEPHSHPRSDSPLGAPPFGSLRPRPRHAVRHHNQAAAACHDGRSVGIGSTTVADRPSSSPQIRHPRNPGGALHHQT